MAARKRASVSSDASAKPPPLQNGETLKTLPKSAETAPIDPPIAPPKLGFILRLSAPFLVPYLYLIASHLDIDRELKRSILINTGLSLVGFFVTVKLIPVASTCVPRRNLFEYDINKKGTPQGTVKV